MNLFVSAVWVEWGAVLAVTERHDIDRPDRFEPAHKALAWVTSSVLLFLARSGARSACERLAEIGETDLKRQPTFKKT